MTESVQSGPQSVIKSIIHESTNLSVAEMKNFLYNISVGLEDIYANMKKLSRIMDNHVPIQIKKENNNENQG